VTRFIRISKTRRLSDIYLLIHEAIEEGVLNIKLMKMPTMRESHRKQQANHSWLNHWAEG
jgi:hypothetical protein